MGGKLLFHESGAGLPKKYQLLIAFTDGSSLTLTVSLWAFVGLVEPGKLGKKPYKDGGLDPLGDELTYKRFAKLFDEYEKPDKNSVKAFMINRPKINGFGNGYLQDMLFRAGIHPKRKVADVSPKERRKLYNAMRKVLTEAVKLGGSAEERDLFDKPGRYERTLNGKAKGKPCPQCSTPIDKVQFLGGASYFCPTCQP
jgi:formamidopyrimidine-DNA glycosylase